MVACDRIDVFGESSETINWRVQSKLLHESLCSEAINVHMKPVCSQLQLQNANGRQGHKVLHLLEGLRMFYSRLIKVIEVILSLDIGILVL